MAPNGQFVLVRAVRRRGGSRCAVSCSKHAMVQVCRRARVTPWYLSLSVFDDSSALLLETRV